MKRFVGVLSVLMLLPGFMALAQPKSGIESEYPNAIGHLRFVRQQIGFNNIFNTEIRSDTLKMFNEWNQLMTIGVSNLPEYIKVMIVPQELKPQQKGTIIVSFDAAKRNDWGFVGDRITLKTNDSLQPEKSIGLSANIVEDFSKMTPAQREKAAKIKFDTTTYDFGTIKEGQKIETEFKFKNLGDSLLRIRKVKGS